MPELIQRVIIFGNSLILAGIEAGLRACPGLEVVLLDETTTGVELMSACPNVVIYDMAVVQAEILLSYLGTQPHLLLIGIDPESHDVLLTGQAMGSITLGKLTQIVHNWEPDPVRSSETET